MTREIVPKLSVLQELNLHYILFGLKFAVHVMVIQQAEAHVSIGVLNIQIQVQHHTVTKYLAKLCK